MNPWILCKEFVNDEILAYSNICIFYQISKVNHNKEVIAKLFVILNHDVSLSYDTFYK